MGWEVIKIYLDHFSYVVKLTASELIINSNAYLDLTAPFWIGLILNTPLAQTAVRIIKIDVSSLPPDAEGRGFLFIENTDTALCERCECKWCKWRAARGN